MILVAIGKFLVGCHKFQQSWVSTLVYCIMAVFTMTASCAGTMWQVGSWIIGMLQTVSGASDTSGLAGQSLLGPVGTNLLGFINSIVPLTEMGACIVILAHWVIFWLLYRHLRSWFPDLAVFGNSVTFHP